MRNVALCCVLLSGAIAHGAVTLQFDPSRPDIGPFPNDALTVPDFQQKTGKRVMLPVPDCGTQLSACQATMSINQLDGFSVLARISLKFSGPINPNTLRDAVKYVALENLTNDENGLEKYGEMLPINEVVWDPATNTAYAKPDYILDQHRRFAIIVTDAVKDTAGEPVQPDPAFLNCIAGRTSTQYCHDLADAVAKQIPNFGGRVITGATVFTTMSATASLEAIRSQIVNDTPLPPSTGDGWNVVDVSKAASVTLKLQTKTTGETTDTQAPAQLLTALGKIAYGTFQSQQYVPDPSLSVNASTVSNPPTRWTIFDPVKTNTLAFHIYVPSTPPPAGGYPVVIFGHGLGDMSYGGATVVAPVLNKAGFAVAAINAFGHGGGPKSRVDIVDQSGNTITLPIMGRGVDLTGDGNIDPTEGCILPNLTGTRDCLRQTALDIVQLARVLQNGTLTFGAQQVAVNPNRMYYAGQSLGSIYGTIVSAIEPKLRASALNVGGGTMIEIARWSPVYHPITQLTLGLQQPPLLNGPCTGTGATEICDFTQNYVLRYQPAKSITVPGAAGIQQYLELSEWYEMPGDPIAYAPHLKSSTLPGVQIKPVMFQFARGDQSVPNPANSELIRAANMREQSIMYRADLARTVIPSLPANPHTFLVSFGSIPELVIAAAAQTQIAGFLASDGNTIPDVNSALHAFVNGLDLFVTPDVLPEDFGFLDSAVPSP